MILMALYWCFMWVSDGSIVMWLNSERKGKQWEEVNIAAMFGGGLHLSWSLTPADVLQREREREERRHSALVKANACSIFSRTEKEAIIPPLNAAATVEGFTPFARSACVGSSPLYILVMFPRWCLAGAAVLVMWTLDLSLTLPFKYMN